jgi:hypothetical protein
MNRGGSAQVIECIRNIVVPLTDVRGERLVALTAGRRIPVDDFLALAKDRRAESLESDCAEREKALPIGLTYVHRKNARSLTVKLKGRGALQKFA